MKYFDVDCPLDIICHFSMWKTMTSESYVVVLKQFLSNQLAFEDQSGIENFNHHRIWPYRTKNVLPYFKNRIIAIDCAKFTNPGMNCPPYSTHLSPSDSFLWCALKHIVYQISSSTLDELKSSICLTCNFFSVEILQDGI